MRPVFSIALILLALTLLLNQAERLFPDAERLGRGADRALEIVAAAKGPLLPAASVGSGPERIGQALRIGERTLVDPGRRGLHAAFVAPDLAFEGERWFDVAGSLADARALAARLAAADTGELVVLASAGRLEPAGPDAPALAQELAGVLHTLGARARPGAHTPESWALLALRGLGDWIVLCEGYSQDSGVVLSFTFAPELERYDDFRGELALVRAPRETQVFLEEELGAASHVDAGTELVRDRAVGGRRLAGILEPPLVGADGTASASSLVWQDVALGQGSGLLAWVGLADDGSAGSDGVVFEVRVDGETVASHPVAPGAPLKVLQADLRPFAGRTVALELRVDPHGSGTGDAALWGRPLLVQGYERSPLEAWAAGR